jgi:hypothetical protein
VEIALDDSATLGSLLIGVLVAPAGRLAALHPALAAAGGAPAPAAAGAHFVQRVDLEVRNSQLGRPELWKLRPSCSTENLCKNLRELESARMLGQPD